MPVYVEEVTLLEGQIESPNSISHVERYNEPFRVSFEKIKDDI